MKNKISTTQIFAYIFDELSENENDRIEDLIVEDEVSAIQISELMQYCRNKNIQSSSQLSAHLDFLRHQFFHDLTKKGVELPELLQEKYQEIPVEKHSPLPPADEDKKDQRGFNWNWIFGLGLILVGALALFVFYPSKKIGQAPTVDESVENPVDSNQEKENIKEDSLVQPAENTPFDQTIPENNLENKNPSKKEEPSILPPPNNNLPIAATLDKDEFYQKYNVKYSPAKLVGPGAMNIRTKKMTEEEWIDQVKGFIKSDSLQPNSLDESKYYQIGRYYLKYHKSEPNYLDLALKYFQKISNKKEPTVDWFMMHAYIFQQTPESLQLAKNIFQERIENNSPRRVQKFVEEMPEDLKDFLKEE